MPIEGRNLGEVSTIFKSHLNRLLASTITYTPLVPLIVQEKRRLYLSFRNQGGAEAAEIKTQYGPMQLFIGQTCDIVDGDERPVRLRTISYRYGLQLPGAREPLFRWEYVKLPPDPDARWCRHHFQGPVQITFGEGQSSVLNDLHLPTGWVTIEEVIRFCIVDLGVAPIQKGEDDHGVPFWHKHLAESYETFKTVFARLGEA